MSLFFPCSQIKFNVVNFKLLAAVSPLCVLYWAGCTAYRLFNKVLKRLVSLFLFFTNPVHNTKTQTNCKFCIWAHCKSLLLFEGAVVRVLQFSCGLGPLSSDECIRVPEPLLVMQ